MDAHLIREEIAAIEARLATAQRALRSAELRRATTMEKNEQDSVPDKRRAAALLAVESAERRFRSLCARALPTE